MSLPASMGLSTILHGFIVWAMLRMMFKEV